MKSPSVFILLILTSLSSHADDQCKFEAAAPKKYRCTNGQTYIKTKITCRVSGIHPAAFCQERHINDAKLCSTDVDPDTLSCHQELFSVKDDEVDAPENEVCGGGFLAVCSSGSAKTEKASKVATTNKTATKKANPTASSAGSSNSVKPSAGSNPNVDRCYWKAPGVAYHECEGETFAYGNLECEHRGPISHLFCKAAVENKVDDCIGDNDPITVRCLAAMTGLRAKKPTNPVTTIPATTAPNNGNR